MRAREQQCCRKGQSECCRGRCKITHTCSTSQKRAAIWRGIPREDQRVVSLLPLATCRMPHKLRLIHWHFIIKQFSVSATESSRAQFKFLCNLYKNAVTFAQKKHNYFREVTQQYLHVYVHRSKKTLTAAATKKGTSCQAKSLQTTHYPHGKMMLIHHGPTSSRKMSLKHARRARSVSGSIPGISLQVRICRSTRGKSHPIVILPCMERKPSASSDQL